MTKLPHNSAPEKSVSPRGAADLAYIRREISIELTARLLGLDVTSRHFARCFREENHADGDREPSLHFFKKKNRAICFGCGDRRAYSNLDLVMGVLDCDLPKAIAWFREHFNIPSLRGRPGGVTPEKSFRVGTGGELEAFIHSGVYATLSHPAARVLAVIRELRDENGEAQLPYATIRRKTGIASDTTVKNALDELTGIHLLDTRKGRVGVLQPQNIYRLTPEHPDLVRLMTDTYHNIRADIDRECEYRRELKRARRRRSPEP
jgi:hypothetical protein